MKLSIGILISNRKETVKKCLGSVKPLLERGIAELICVDTVTETPGLISDGSADIAKEYTDKVYSFKWIKDFSAARNVTLDHASGEWYVFLDDDEWFEDVSEIADFFETNEYLKFNSASFIIRNYKNKKGTEWTDTRAVRFVKRSSDLRFKGSVHESYSSVKLPCKEFNSFAHHYGYAYENEEEKKAHRERNLGILEEEIKRRPEDLRLRTQMALELANFDNERALNYIREVLKEFETQKNEVYYQWLESLKFPLFEALGKSPEEAEAELKNIQGSVKLSESALLSIHYNLTRQWLIKGIKEKARPHIQEYFGLLEILKKDSDLRQIQNTADFERYLSDESAAEMKKYEEYCMENNGIKIENGVLSFGEKKIELQGSVDEKLKQLDQMPFDDFKVTVNGLIQKASSCFEDEFLNAAIEYFFSASQIEYCYLLYKMSEEEIKRAVERGANGAAIFEIFNECICTERKMYELLYKPEVFTEKGIRWMGTEVRYNDILYRFISTGAKDLKMTLEAAKLRPDMANVIKTWLGALR